MSLTVELPSTEEISALDAAGLEQMLVDAERVRRQIEAVLVDVMDEADERKVWADDRHASVRQWAMALTNISGAEMSRRMQTLRAVRDLDVLRDRLRAGEIGVCQARELARVHANPRVRDQLPESEELLVGHGERLDFDQYKVVLQRWVWLADPDGASRDRDEIHRARDAKLTNVGDEYHLDARGGTGQGASMEAIFRAFCHAEFDADWNLCRRQHGDDAAVSLMNRTPAQRRFDALHQLFQAAAANAPDQVSVPDPLVNIVVDQRTFEEYMAHAAGGPPPAPDPTTVDERRCETSDGVILDPRDVIAAAMTGHVRRVVFDGAGVVINLGRKRRIFTGSARQAAFLHGRRCLWPGCDQPRTQLDHHDEWAHDHGGTDQHNCGPLCGRHNRWKHRGYRVTRQPDGTIIVLRPDGTRLDQPRAA